MGNNMKLSVIIPTFKSPEMLDLCLESAIKGQSQENQIIVVVDGHYNLNKEVLEKHKDSIDILNLEQNQGLCRGTNLGVMNAHHDKILIVNDDNVFPKNWDEKLMYWKLKDNQLITPNQIEPNPSMFPQFNIKNLGKTYKELDLNSFWEYEDSISKEQMDIAGSTLPIYMKKQDYLKIGGWDENYELGMVADWDFFLKCNLSNMGLTRVYNCHFYHFASISTNGEKRQKAEKNGHNYAKYKWGKYIQHNLENNLKYI
jgi:O-antigen biosynthesis protein